MKNKKLNKVYSFQKVNGTLQGKLSVDKKSHRRHRAIDVLLIVISLMVAVIIWLVASNNVEQSKNFNIELNIIGSEQLKEATGLEIYSVSQTMITVQVTGRGPDIAAINEADLVPAINVRDYSGDGGTIDFDVSLVNAELSAVSLQCFPSVVTLYLDKTETRTVSLSVNPTYNIPQGYEVTPAVDSIEITGPKREVERIAKAVVSISAEQLTSAEESGMLAVLPTFLDHKDVSVEANVTHIKKMPIAVKVEIKQTETETGQTED